MNNTLNWEIIAAIGASVAAAITVTVMMFQLREARYRRYDEVKGRADLESVRKALEEQIYRLTDRLVSSDQRWQDVNHLLLSAQRATSEKELTRESTQIPRLEFLARAGVDLSNLAIDRKLVFVLIPFHPDFDGLYWTIKDTCQRVGLTCLRGDEEHVPVGNILGHILQLIAKARLVIAAVDGRNPNVFYELGISHALGKSVILLGRSLEEIPFDIRSTRVLLYGGMDQLPPLLTAELTKVFASD